MRVNWLVASTILGALAVAPGYAQTAQALRVTVPFEFTVNNTTMPAGEYWIGDGGLQGAKVLSVRSSDNRHAALFVGHVDLRDNAPEKPTLEFDHYGNSYFLAQIWWAGATSGVELTKSKTEKELARTASVRQSERVVLMASR